MTLLCVRGVEEIDPEGVFRMAREVLEQSGMPSNEVRFLVTEVSQV